MFTSKCIFQLKGRVFEVVFFLIYLIEFKRVENRIEELSVRWNKLFYELKNWKIRKENRTPDVEKAYSKLKRRMNSFLIKFGPVVYNLKASTFSWLQKIDSKKTFEVYQLNVELRK